jgi:hypothetical protein
MLSVEQVFLRVRLQNSNWTAQVSAATNAVSRVDQDELKDWFTGSEQDLTIRCDPFNLFFHPLPSGHYALAVIDPAQQKVFSLWGKSQTFNVRVLLVSPQRLLEQGNHPVTLFETLRRQNQIPLDSQLPQTLPPLVLPDSPLQINASLLDTLVNRLGAMALAQLIQSLFAAECTLFASKSVSALSVLSALFDLLPIRYRPELTFSSDFFLSPKNSFRLTGFSKLPHRTIRLMKQWGVPVISLEQGNKGSFETLDPWSRFVYQLLQSQNFDFWNLHWNTESFTSLTSAELQPIIWDNLHEVGVVLSKAMSSGTLPDKPLSATDLPSHSVEELRCVAAVEQIIPMFSGPKPSVAKSLHDQRLGERFPQFQGELSELEAYLVRGIFGDESAIPHIKRIWLQLTLQLESETKASIQEALISTIHAVLASLEGSAELRLQRGTQLLELMVFFLQEPAR